MSLSSSTHKGLHCDKVECQGPRVPMAVVTLRSGISLDVHMLLSFSNRPWLEAPFMGRPPVLQPAPEFSAFCKRIVRLVELSFRFC